VKTRQHSIRRRLIATVVLSQLLLALGLVLAGVFYTQRRLLAALDAGIQSRAMSVAALVRYTEDASGNVYFDNTLMPRSLDPSHPDLFAIWTERSGLLTRSANWPAGLTVSPDERHRHEHWYFVSNGVPYRVLRFTHVPVLDREEGKAFQPQTLTIVYAAPLVSLRQQVWASGFFIALASLLLLGITVLLALWGIRRGLLPLQILAEQAAAVSARTWNLHVPEEIKQSAELWPLIESMALMLSRLHESFEQEKEFMANATHELKTPVAVLKSTLQSVLQLPRTAEEYRAGLERSLEDLGRLEGLMQGMLRLARADRYARGMLRLQWKKPTDLATTCQAAVERIRVLADAKRVRITLSCNGAVAVQADPEDLQLVWVNLLENAVRYSPEGETVEVGVVRKHVGRVQVIFADHGPGIPENELPHIFDRFYRGDPSRTRATGGFGLGLAISKAVVTAYGGTIRAENAAGQGTRMTVELLTAGAGV
jgi:signal transduction histidine kinase